MPSFPSPALPCSAHRPFQTGQSSERPTLSLTLCGRGDLKTDVPCHWHGAEKGTASHGDTVYMCVFDSRGRGRWRKKLNGWMAMSGGRRRSSAGWVAKVSRGGGACKRRNKSTQSHWWQTAAAVSLGILSRSSSSEQSADAG